MQTSPQKPQNLFWLPATLGAVVLLMASIAGAGGWHNLSIARSAASWRTIDATVVTSELGTREVRDPRDGRYRTYPTVEFAWQFDLHGDRYRGTHMNPSGMQSVDASVVRAHPLGSHLTVYYDPSNPMRSSMNTDTRFGDYLFVVIAAILTLISLPFWWLSVRWWRKGQVG